MPSGKFYADYILYSRTNSDYALRVLCPLFAKKDHMLVLYGNARSQSLGIVQVKSVAMLPMSRKYVADLLGSISFP